MSWIFYVLLFVLLFLLFFFNFFVVTVIGDSMYPTLKDGQRFLCKRILIEKNFRKLKGRVCVYYPPQERENEDDEPYFVIKRLTRVSPTSGKCYFEGDNKTPGKSYDSRAYGFVDPTNVLGYIIKKV